MVKVRARFRVCVRVRITIRGNCAMVRVRVRVRIRIRVRVCQPGPELSTAAAVTKPHEACGAQVRARVRGHTRPVGHRWAYIRVAGWKPRAGGATVISMLR